MNKIGFFLLLILTGVLLFSCKKETSLDEGCISQFLESHNAKRANDVVGCEFFYALYEFEGKQYFVLGSHCADMITIPLDCSDNNYCKNKTEEMCSNFFNKALYKGVVGIRK